MDSLDPNAVSQPVAVHLSLDWWPLSPDEPMGEDRARDLVTKLRRVIGPIVAEAEADLRTRMNYAMTVMRYAEPVQALATRSLSAEMTALCLGILYPQHDSGESNSIELRRDGTVTWRRWSRRP